MSIFARFENHSQVQYGILEENKIIPISGTPLNRWEICGPSLKLEEVKLLAPVEPGKIIGIGSNYYDDLNAKGKTAPKEPPFFIKVSSAIVGHGEDIVFPSVDDAKLYYEAELAVVINKKAKNVPVEEALDYIFGYTCANDVMLKKPLVDLPRAKNYDTFVPLGPFLVTEIDGKDLSISCSINKKQTQSSRTSNMVFGVAEIISYLSAIMTLEPGDVIITGTPAGAGFVEVGDCIDVEIEGLGTLTNQVVQG